MSVVYIGVVAAAIAAVWVGYWAAVGRKRFSHIPSLKGKHVMITGGSSGIGLCVAKQCAAEGAHLTLVARTLSKLEDAKRQITASCEIPADSIHLKAVDVGNAAAVAEAVAESFEWRPIDVLVCSAGIVEANFVEDVKPSRLEEIVRTNILGVIFPVQSVIPRMKARSKQHPSSIVIIGSLSSLVPQYGGNMYSPTKCALKGLVELLKFELLPFRIGVTMSIPGYTYTPMLEEVEKDGSEFLDLCGHMYIMGLLKQSPEDVARITIAGFKRNEFLVSTTFQGFLVRVIGRGFVPPDSLPILFMEILLIVPLRILTFVLGLNAKRILLTHKAPTKKKA